MDVEEDLLIDVKDNRMRLTDDDTIHDANKKYDNYDEFKILINKAYQNILSTDNTTKKSGVFSLIKIVKSIGVYAGTLQEFVYEAIIGLAFDPKEISEIHEISLTLIEVLITFMPLSLTYLVKYNLIELIFNYMNEETKSVPRNRLSYIVNSLAAHSQESYDILMENNYLSFLFSCILDSTDNKDDLCWALTSLHSIIISPYFQQFDVITSVYDTVSTCLDTNNLEIISTCLSMISYLIVKDICFSFDNSLLFSKAIYSVQNAFHDDSDIVQPLGAIQFLNNFFLCFPNDSEIVIRKNILKEISSVYTYLSEAIKIDTLVFFNNVIQAYPNGLEQIELNNIFPTSLLEGNIKLKTESIKFFATIVISQQIEVSLQIIENLGILDKLFELLFIDDVDILKCNIYIFGHLFAKLQTSDEITQNNFFESFNGEIIHQIDYLEYDDETNSLAPYIHQLNSIISSKISLG